MNNLDLLVKDNNLDNTKINKDIQPDLVVSKNNIDINNKSIDIGLDLLMNNNAKKDTDSISVKSIDSNTLTLNAGDDVKSNISSIDLDTLKPREEINANDIKLNSGGSLNDFFKDDANKNIPSSQPQTQQFSSDEIKQQKRELLFKYERHRKRNSNMDYKNLSMNDSLEEIKLEVDKITHSKKLDASVKFQRKLLMAAVTGVEFLNNRFDPFNIQLDGWSESVNNDLDDYDETFEELYEKYKGSGEIAPELKLMFMLVGSGFMFHLSKTLFKSSLPGMQDIMKDNPDLMKQFMGAAMKGMTNNMMNNNNNNNSGGGGGRLMSGLGNMMGGMNMMAGMNTGMNNNMNNRNPPPQQQNNNMFSNMSSQQPNNDIKKNNNNETRPEMNTPDGNDIEDILAELRKNEKDNGTITLDI